ncbi:hypothetical protein [Marinobacter similis]|nr:hypothetical protein [Marinobacter similis]
MSPYTPAKTTSTYVDVLTDDAVAHGTSSIAQWLNPPSGNDEVCKGANNVVTLMNASTAVSNVSMEKAQDAMEALNRIADQGQEAAAAASENDVYSGQIESIGRTLNQNASRFRV